MTIAVGGSAAAAPRPCTFRSDRANSLLAVRFGDTLQAHGAAGRVDSEQNHSNVTAMACELTANP
jgi:hypothetical protein